MVCIRLIARVRLFFVIALAKPLASLPSDNLGHLREERNVDFLDATTKQSQSSSLE